MRAHVPSRVADAVKIHPPLDTRIASSLIRPDLHWHYVTQGELRER